MSKRHQSCLKTTASSQAGGGAGQPGAGQDWAGQHAGPGLVVVLSSWGRAGQGSRACWPRAGGAVEEEASAQWATVCFNLREQRGWSLLP